MGCYKLTVEVPLLLFYGTCIMVGNLIINLMTYKVCYNILHYPEANCSRLGRFTDNETQALEKIVQPHAGLMTAVTEMVPATVPVFLALLIGSWSDKFGRKPIILFVLGSMTIGFGISAIMLMFRELNPWFLMLGAIPTMWCGGITAFFTAILAYLNDIATPETRAIRMVTFDIVQVVATLCGGLSSSYIFYATSYAAIYGISCVISAFCTIYTYFFIQESLEKPNNERPRVKDIFGCNNVKNLFRTAFKKRRYNKRNIIVLIIFSFTVLGFITNGETNVKTQYLRNKLNWTLTKRNIFGAWSSLVGVIGTFSATYFLHKKLNVNEIVLIILALMSLVGSTLFYAGATDDSHIYMSVPVGIFGGVANPMLKTMLTKIIVPGEMGKIFSLLMVINSFCLLGSALTYQEIYNSTLKTRPEIFNYVSISLDGAVMIAVIIMIFFECQIPPGEVRNEEEFISPSNEKLADAM